MGFLKLEMQFLLLLYSSVLGITELSWCQSAYLNFTTGRFVAVYIKRWLGELKQVKVVFEESEDKYQL